MATETLPIVIAGAGPCGLVAALTLQHHGVPFRIVERASREKLCSNVGAGFNLSNSAVDVLCQRLGLEAALTQKIVQYAGIQVMDPRGDVLRAVRTEDAFGPERRFFTKRADLQTICLDALERLEEVLVCGVEVTGYEQAEGGDAVSVALSDGTRVRAAALLGCDGIHSAVRRHMFAGVDDALSFTGQHVWWGKVKITPELAAELEKTQPFKEEGVSMVWYLGTPEHPGPFLGVPTDDTFIFVFFNPADEPPAKRGSDLTRRGGATLDSSSKQELLTIVAGRAPVLRTAIDAAPAEAITKAGLFDRANLDLPYVHGRVALLGDAAHPQTPAMGQGVNMAIVDAYVLSARCSKQGIPDAMHAYNDAQRRSGVKAVVQQARANSKRMTTRNWFFCWMRNTLVRFAPLKWALGGVGWGDRSNQEFVAAVDKQFAST